MDSNTHSAQPPEPPQREDLDRLTDTALAQEALALQQAMDRLEGQWLRRLAAVDARGAAGADQDQPAASTASWLRNGLRLGAGRPVRPSRPPGRCSAAPSPTPPTPSPAGSSRPRMLGCWRRAPAPSPTTAPETPNRSWSKPPAAWTHRGCARRWDTCSRSPIPRAPTGPRTTS